jgi:hypothetical protein
MRHLAEMRLAGLWIGLWRAMDEDGPHPGTDQAVESGVRVLGRRVVVAPVAERGRSAVDLVPAAEEFGMEQVLRLEQGCQAAMNVAKVLQQGPVGREPAQAGLPGVHVGVDQPGDDDPAARVDALRAIGCELRADGRDAVALDQ